MSEQDDPVESRLQQLVAAAGDDAPQPPTIDEMTRLAPAPERPDATSRRRWVAGGAIGIAAALVVALIVLPGRDDEAVPVDTPDDTVVEPTAEAPDAVATTSLPTDAPVPIDDPREDASSVDDPAVTTSSPASTTTVPPVAADPTVIAAVDANGDAVLIPADGGEPLIVYDGADPDAEAPEEGPGPTMVDSIALRPGGNSVFVGLCCEPIAGSILSGAPDALAPNATSFGYAPAVSPDDRYLAVGQIQGPALAITDLNTGFDLEVPDFGDAVGDYSPYDTMWLDETRVVSIGIESSDDGLRWIAVPMVVDDADVTVGDPLALDFVQPPSADTVVRAAGVLDGVVKRQYFVVHATDEPAGVPVEFRMDGDVGSTGSVVGLDEPARSIWYEPDGSVLWVDEAGVLHRGDETIAGEYLWARPTDATEFFTVGGTDGSPTSEPPGIDPATALEIEEQSAFGFAFGDEVFVPALIDRISADIGEPTFDTGWQPMPDEWVCTPAPQFRTVWWGDFRMTFEGDGSGDATLSGWSVGDPLAAFAPLGEAPTDPLASDIGVEPGLGLGASRADVLAAAPPDMIVGDQPDRVAFAGALPFVFLIVDDQVTGIGSGRYDCIDESSDQ